MRVLLSTIGSRGDVQPLVALALQLREYGEQVRICAPPDFGAWVDGLRIPFVPIGPAVRPTAGPAPAVRPTADQVRQLMKGTVATQFETLPAAAAGCDVVVAGNALQVAARSVAELQGSRYVFTAYCPITLPSPHHAPPRVLAWTPADLTAGNRALWAEDADGWNDRWGGPLNAHRAALGLDPVDDVRGHILTAGPWLAADPTLAPWAGDVDVFQPGAWLLPDRRPLPAEVETFLDAGEPPVYLGFGSIRAPDGLAATMIDAVRATGRRAVLSRGWAGLALPDDGPDGLSVGELNQQALFPRVAAVVHHGGAGTTTAAARAGTPQVVVPQHYDQHYYAGRVRELGIGVAHPPAVPTTASLTAALAAALHPDVGTRAGTVAVRTDGTRIAVERLVACDAPR